MDERRHTTVSKFLSFVLRHRPDEIGLSLDEAGWANIDDLIDRAAGGGVSFSRAELDDVVAGCPKRRFALSEDGLRIRASQGHSLDVDLGYEPALPPAALYHGTHSGVAELIREAGLRKMARHHVHLSTDAATAEIVGRRRGTPIVFLVDAAAMAADGHEFFVSENGVWLTDHVPPRYLSLPQ